jgi:predicted alpha-1,2-mannosidase
LLAAACGGGEDETSITSYVDPFLGTGAHGHVYPGATVPFGMVQLSPDNGRSGWDWVSGYHYSDSVIVGFSHTHLSGTGIGDLADILVMPLSQPVDIAPRWESRDERAAKSGFSHERESAEPGYYSVVLDDQGITAELTATERVGVHRYTFSNDADPHLLVDLGYAVNWDQPTETYLRVENDTLVVGYRHSTGWAEDQRVFFAMALSRPVVTLAMVNDTISLGQRDEARGRRLRALLELAPARSDQLLLKVGISYVDVAGALRNLEEEVPGWDFDLVRAAARVAWEAALNQFRVWGGSGREQRVFYTSLYRSKLAPVLFQDVDARYRGGDARVHTARDFRNYSVFSLWDTFRAAHPLYTITDPDRVDDFVNSMLAFERETGWLPVWSLVGNETNTMTGFHAVPVIADAYLKGFGGFDADAAMSAMIRFGLRDWRGLREYRRLGYVPSGEETESVTKTLEYAFDDWSVGQMAAAMGRDRDAEYFLGRAGSFANVFDSTTGFMRGKTARGRWSVPFDPLRSSHRESTDYTEGNAWQHSWFAPHDVRGLIDLMGGDSAFIARLDQLFESDTSITGENVSPDISGLIGQYAHGNEPSHHISYLYNYAGAPWRTQETVREIMRTLYDIGPEGLAGNEDCGQMSAWYVFSALGLYPVNPVGGIYVIGSPVFEEVSIDLGAGRSFAIIARRTSQRNRFIQSATLNGQPLERTFLRHEEIMGGGTLELVMGSRPNEEWGAKQSERPPSMSDPVNRTDMANSVQEAFLHAWRGYEAYAWGHDALKPLSRGYRDWYDRSLYMTPVDAFDTMLLMGLDEEAARAKQLVLDSLSFDQDFSVQVFEVTIRLLGALNTAYQMDGDPRFLELATDLADRLLPAFESATGMPYGRVHLQTGEREWQVSNPAEIGTLMLEFGTLSKLSGEPVYYETAKRAVTALFERRSEIGLVGTTIDVETGEWQNTDSHVSGMIDSYYEYLLKAWLLFDDDDFKDMWEQSIDPLHEHLADSLDSGLWYGRADMHSGERTAMQFGALDCFLPGVLALAGDLERASRVMDACYLMWTEFDIEPEQLDYASMEVLQPAYYLRPEAMESAYILFRLTGDERYLVMGKTMFESIVRHTRTPTGFAHLRSVVTKQQDDAMESFFLAETLKYAYLLFAPAETLPFGDVVFNTEAHPIWRTW